MEERVIISPRAAGQNPEIRCTQGSARKASLRPGLYAFACFAGEGEVALR